MLSKEKKVEYHNMPLSEKMSLVLDMCRESSQYLLMGDAEHVARKFELLNRENDLRNENMLTAIARTREDRNGER